MSSINSTRLMIAWLAVGLIVKMVVLGGVSPFNPMFWVHVLLWPLFLLIAAASMLLKVTMLALVAAGAVWFLLRKREG